MTSNNETFSRQNLSAGSIAKSTKSQDNSAPLAANFDRGPPFTARVNEFSASKFPAIYITNHLKTGSSENSSFCFPRISMFEIREC